MKVIFLDIDGVLNVEVYITAIATMCGRLGLDYNEHLRDEFGMDFCPLSCRYLEHIIDRTDAKIIITSTWRSDGLEKLNKMWKHRKLPGDVIGITKNYCANEDLKWKDRKERGNEIQEYLDTHPEISNYVIIDDDNDMLDSQQKNYVKTNPQYGITDIVANKSIKILCKV
jgi:hypothetical protein